MTFPFKGLHIIIVTVVGDSSNSDGNRSDGSNIGNSNSGTINNGSSNSDSIYSDSSNGDSIYSDTIYSDSSNIISSISDSSKSGSSNSDRMSRMCPTVLPAVACIIGENLHNSKYLSYNPFPIMTKVVKMSVRTAGSRPNKAPQLFTLYFF